MGRAGWLRCKLHRGMFSGEYAVVVETNDGRVLTFFAPDDFLQPGRRPAGSEEVEGRVRVQVLDEGSGVVYLPREPFEGSPFIRVPPNVLAVA